MGRARSGEPPRLTDLGHLARCLSGQLLCVGAILGFSWSSLAQIEARTSRAAGLSGTSLSQESRIKTQPRTSRLSWKAGLTAARSQDTDNNQSSLVRARLGLKYRQLLGSGFQLRARADVASSTGFVQSLEGDDSRSSPFLLRHASADWRPLSWIVTSVGALNQQDIHSRLLFGDRAFPAAQLWIGNARWDSTIQKRSGGWASGVAQAAVPTASTLANQAREREPSPSFWSAGFRSGYRWQNDSYVTLQILRFNYGALPLSVATDSVAMGNTGVEINAVDSEFRYSFAGWEAVSVIETNLTAALTPRLELAWLQNDAAPSGRNQGIRGKIGLSWNLGNWDLTPSYTYFRVDSDAAVATYNDPTIRTNRVGTVAGLDFARTKSFIIGVGYGERVAIREKLTQPRENFIELRLETFDVDLF